MLSSVCRTGTPPRVVGTSQRLYCTINQQHSRQPRFQTTPPLLAFTRRERLVVRRRAIVHCAAGASAELTSPVEGPPSSKQGAFTQVNPLLSLSLCVAVARGAAHAARFRRWQAIQSNPVAHVKPREAPPADPLADALAGARRVQARAAMNGVMKRDGSTRNAPSTAQGKKSKVRCCSWARRVHTFQGLFVDAKWWVDLHVCGEYRSRRVSVVFKRFLVTLLAKHLSTEGGGAVTSRENSQKGGKAGGIRAGILIPLLDNSEEEIQEMVSEVLRDVTANTVVYLGDAAYVDGFSGACSRARVTPMVVGLHLARTRRRATGGRRKVSARRWSASAAVLSVPRLGHCHAFLCLR